MAGINPRIKHRHSPDVPAELLKQDTEGKPTDEGKDSGENDTSKEFEKRYDLKPNFHLECSACCWTFLVDVRRYERIAGKANVVEFGEPLNPDEERTICFLSFSREHGKIMTDRMCKPDQRVSRRVSYGSYTYQLYTNGKDPKTVTIGEPIIARLESIATSYRRDGDYYCMTTILDKDIAGTSMNYCNAALFEFFRMKDDQDPLKGKCVYEQSHHESNSIFSRVRRLSRALLGK